MLKPAMKGRTVVDLRAAAVDGLERPEGANVDRLQVHAPGGRLLQLIAALADAVGQRTAAEDGRLVPAWVVDNRANRQPFAHSHLLRLEFSPLGSTRHACYGNDVWGSTDELRAWGGDDG
jgi:hypothetical protein